MSTLMSQTTGDNYGSKTRRCDAHCYDAKMAKCVCICGGINHGKGLDTATANTQLIADEVAARLREGRSQAAPTAASLRLALPLEIHS